MMKVRTMEWPVVKLVSAILAMLLLIPALPPANETVYAAGSTYYVSSSTGNDDNNGLSTGAPWKTLSKVSSLTFQPGDTIRLMGGDTWHNQALDLHGSGTPGNPITVTSYGTGRPKIKHHLGGENAVSLFNESHWVIRGLEIEVDAPSTLTGGGLQGAGIAVEFDESRGPTTYTDILVDDNFVYGTTIDSLVDGIVVFAYGTGDNINREMASNITISNNEVHDVGKFGIRTDSWKTLIGGAMSSSQLYRNVKIHNNHVYNIGLSPIILNNANHSSLKWNLVHDGGKYDGTGAWTSPGGIWPIQSSYVEMKFNEVYNMSDSNTTADGTGLNIDWSNEFVTVQYNYSHDNEGNGLSTMSNTNAKIMNNRIEGNKGLWNLGKGQIGLSAFRSAESPLSGLKNLEISDNLIVVDEPNTFAFNTTAEKAGDWIGNSIHHNRIVLKNGVSNIGVYHLKTDAMIDSIDYNRIYSSSGTQFAATILDVIPDPDQASHYATLSSWQSGTGYDANSQLLTVDATAPSSPSNLSATSGSSSLAVELAWSAASDAGSGIAHYNVYRSTDPNFTPSYRNMVGESANTTFVDTEELLPSTHYYYKVEAEDFNGNVSHTYAQDDVTSGAANPEPLRVYQAGVDYGVIRQGPVWNYQYWDGTGYTDLPSVYVPWNFWRDGTSYLTVGSFEQSPDSRDAVRTWTSPYAGDITIEANGQIAAANSADGVLVKLMRGTAQVWPASGWQTVTSGSPVNFPSTSFTVAKGEKFHFVVNQNINNFGDSTIWDPIITYTTMAVPTPLPRPLPEMKLVQPILEEQKRIDFENGSSTDFNIAGNGNWTVVNGNTKVFRQTNPYWTTAIVGTEKREDYTIEASVTPTSFTPATGGSVGFNLNYQDNGDRYIVSLYSGNLLLVDKVANGIKKPLFSKYFPVSANSTYNLKAEVYRDGWKGDLTIGIYVNGRKEAIAFDVESILPPGRAGLDSWEAAADFDNVVLQTKANSWVDQQDILFFDNFEDGSASRFTTASGTWSVGTTERTRQLKNTGTASSLIHTGSSSWNNYVLQSNVTIAAAGGSGGAAQLNFRYTDANNTYSAELNSLGSIELFKKVSGTKTSLASKPYPITPGKRYNVKVFSRLGKLDVYIDGKKELTATDSSLTAGKIALQTVNANVLYDEVAVQGLEVPRTVLFSDDFESGSSKWTAGGAWSIVNDRTKEYQQNYQTSVSGSAYNHTGSWTDYEVRAKLSMTESAPEGGFGSVAFRYTDANNKYFFTMSDLGFVELKKMAAGTQTSLASKMYRVVKGSEYRVRIVVNGSNIDVYVNGKKELTATDGTFTSGKIALETYRATVSFDDVTVYDI